MALASGTQAIGTVKVGQKVLAYNPKTQKMEAEPIVHVWKHTDDDLVDLTLTVQTHAPHSSVTHHKSEVIHTNKKHPFLTVEHGFLNVAHVKVGMHVERADGTVGTVTKWQIVPGISMMYNLEVAQDHTFTVGIGQWIVHNCDVGNTAPMEGSTTKDLYRMGNTTSPKLENVRDSKEAINGLVPSNKGLSFNDAINPLGGANRSWIVRAGSKIPEGYRFVFTHLMSDGLEHWELRPTNPVSVQQYIKDVVGAFGDIGKP